MLSVCWLLLLLRTRISQSRYGSLDVHDHLSNQQVAYCVFSKVRVRLIVIPNCPCSTVQFYLPIYLYLHNTIYTIYRTLVVFRVWLRCRPWPPTPPGDRLWQTLTFSRNPNVEPSSYPYSSTEWFSDMPTNFGSPPVRCSQWYKKNGYLDRLKRSRWYTPLHVSNNWHKLDSKVTLTGITAPDLS